jgi:hypothetical protein
MVHENMIASVLKSQILTQVWELLDPFSDVTGVCASVQKLIWW